MSAVRDARTRKETGAVVVTLPLPFAGAICRPVYEPGKDMAKMFSQGLPFSCSENDAIAALRHCEGQSHIPHTFQQNPLSNPSQTLFKPQSNPSQTLDKSVVHIRTFQSKPVHGDLNIYF